MSTAHSMSRNPVTDDRGVHNFLTIRVTRIALYRVDANSDSFHHGFRLEREGEEEILFIVTWSLPTIPLLLLMTRATLRRIVLLRLLLLLLLKLHVIFVLLLLPLCLIFVLLLLRQIRVLLLQRDGTAATATGSTFQIPISLHLLAMPRSAPILRSAFQILFVHPDVR